MFFNNKKAVGLVHGQLAQAITVKSKLDFKKDKDLYMDKKINWFIEDRIDMDEHISFAIKHVYYTNNLSIFMGTYCYLHYYSMSVSTYIDNIKVNNYDFQLDMKRNKNFWRCWELKDKKIIHRLPNEIIKKINDWSEEVVRQKHKELKAIKEKKEEKNKHKLKSEEEKLEETFHHYK